MSTYKCSHVYCQLYVDPRVYCDSMFERTYSIGERNNVDYLPLLLTQAYLLIAEVFE